VLDANPVVDRWMPSPPSSRSLAVAPATREAAVAPF
jgi:hypothetical protein